MEKEQRLLQQRRSSKTSLGGRRYSREEVQSGPPIDAPTYTPTPGDISGRGRTLIDPYRRSSLRRGVVGGMGKDTRPLIHADPHHTLQPSYNISVDGPPPYHPREPLRRGSEPPKPNRCEDISCGCSDNRIPRHILQLQDGEDGRGMHYEGEEGSGRTWEGEERDRRAIGWEGEERHWETDDRDGTRTISRAHLRRDSFGEVVSRRSPSQDSLDHAHHARSPPILLDDPTPRTTPTPPPQSLGGQRSPSEDSYIFGRHTGRTSSQDSLDQQVCTYVCVYVYVCMYVCTYNPHTPV